jgi:hypothetical protein
MLNNIVIENSITSKLNFVERLRCYPYCGKPSMSRISYNYFIIFEPKVWEILNFIVLLSLEIQQSYKR